MKPSRKAQSRTGGETPESGVSFAKPDASVPIDYWRQLDVFSPADFKKPVTVIGAGATGSYVALCLAKMGVKNITVFDHDTVESHNPPNQVYGRSSHGHLKVEALREEIKRLADIEIVAKPSRFERGRLKGVVFNLVDSMEGRRQIWQSSVRFKPQVELYIETRLAAQAGWVFAVRPMLPTHVERYEATFCSDEEAEEPACTNRSISSTVMVVSGFAVHLLVNHLKGQRVCGATCVSLSPPLIDTEPYP